MAISTFVLFIVLSVAAVIGGYAGKKDALKEKPVTPTAVEQVIEK